MALNVGDTAPDFELTSHLGEQLKLSELVATKPVALVFFPLAFSGICTGELCELQDNLRVFESSGVQVVGISVDSKFALKAWAEQEGYDFPILADFWPHGAVAKQYGVFIEESGIANRATFVIDANRQVKAAIITAPGQARDFDAYRAALGELTA